MTSEGDLVLVYIENQPAFFARIESIFADVKPQWFQVKMLVLQVPVAVVTWILREPYINGEEFTMGGRPIRMEKVIAPVEETEDDGRSGVSEDLRNSPQEDESIRGGEVSEKGKVISLTSRRKKPSTP
jgi:hypothetical protein